MTSITAADYRTMNPMDKYRSPRPAPTVPGMARSLVSSSPSEALQLQVQVQRPSRSQSPTLRWVSARRLFGLKSSKRGSSADRSNGGATAGAISYSDTEDTASVKSSHSNHSSQSYPSSERNTRSTTPSGSSRSRDMSPEALRRFLSDDKPVVTTPPVESNPNPAGLSIPEQIMEENEDDDNFASHAAAEVAPSTLLSPPPFLRSFSSPSIASCANNASSDTIVPSQEASATEHKGVRHSHSMAFKLHIPKSRFSLSSSSSIITTPFSPTSSTSRSSRSSRGAGSSSSYFGGDNDEETDDMEEEDEEEDDLGRLSRDDHEKLMGGKAASQPFAGYSLPPQTTTEAGQKQHQRDASVVSQAATITESPQFLARCDNGLPVCGSNATLLGLPTIDAGLEDLSSDVGWMADIIRARE